MEFTGKNTFFGKTAQMLQGQDGLGNLQKILLKAREQPCACGCLAVQRSVCFGCPAVKPQRAACRTCMLPHMRRRAAHTR